MKRVIAMLVLALSATVAWALPTAQQVESAVREGNYAQAETMMSEVVAAKPRSARAHYAYAEILAHNARFAQASTEAKEAQRIDPKLAFTEPDKFRAFEQTLEREQAATRTPPARRAEPEPMSSPAAVAASRPGIPGWVWLVGLLVVAAVLWRGFSRSRAAPVAGGAMGNAYATPGHDGMPNGGGYGQPMQPGVRPGSGLLGTGLAVAGGLAGGMLIDEMLHRRSDGTSPTNNIGGFDPNGYSPSADTAATELENRPVDFGSGDDWDSGGGSLDGGDAGGGWD